MITLADYLATLELDPPTKLKCAKAIYDFASLGAYLQSCSHSIDALYVLKYIIQHKAKFYMLPRIYGRYRKLRSIEDYQGIRAYCIDKGISPRDLPDKFS